MRIPIRNESGSEKIRMAGRVAPVTVKRIPSEAFLVIKSSERRVPIS
jgi:hypothetical protein